MITIDFFDQFVSKLFECAIILMSSDSCPNANYCGLNLCNIPSASITDHR